MRHLKVRKAVKKEEVELSLGWLVIFYWCEVLKRSLGEFSVRMSVAGDSLKNHILLDPEFQVVGTILLIVECAAAAVVGGGSIQFSALTASPHPHVTT